MLVIEEDVGHAHETPDVNRWQKIPMELLQHRRNKVSLWAGLV